jgi:hypothetical protein
MLVHAVYMPANAVACGHSLEDLWHEPTNACRSQAAGSKACLPGDKVGSVAADSTGATLSLDAARTS